MKTLSAIALALAMPSAAAASDYAFGDLRIMHPRIFETAATARAGGGYVTITNVGETDDTLVGVDADFPKVELHRSYEEDGVMRMQHVDGIAVPAGETVELAPGGYHVMFMGLSAPFEAGNEVPVTLSFQKAGDVEIMFNVEKRTGDMGHGGMDHSSGD